jgi:hypothetical protein
LPGTPSPTPSPTPTPKPNPNPTPDPVDPNLGEGDASIVQKLDVSNKYLENIDVGIDNLIQANNNNNKELISYQKFILGELQNGIGGGGGGGGSPGEGECDPDTEECSGDGNTVKENACTEFTCEGDNIACYLARREWEKKCQVEDFINPEGDGSKIMDEFTKFIDENPVENIESGELDVGRIMNKYTNGNGLEITAGCPAPRIVDAKIASFTVNYEPFCDLALVINWFLISLSMVGATLLISKYGL